MRKIITTLTLLCSLNGSVLLAQTNSATIDFNLTDQMGVFVSQFKIFSNSQNLNPAKQIIGKRIFSKENNPTQAETWSFEFTSSSALQKVKEPNNKGQYKISCFEDKKNLLFTVYVSKEDVVLWNNGTYYTYAINMQDFPIILMDNISVIDIVEIEQLNFKSLYIQPI